MCELHWALEKDSGWFCLLDSANTHGDGKLLAGDDTVDYCIVTGLEMWPGSAQLCLSIRTENTRNQRPETSITDAA